jgi:hypothetical protein
MFHNSYSQEKYRRCKVLKRFAMLLLVLIMTLTIAGPAAADDSGPNDAATPEDSGVGGLVPPKGAGGVSDSVYYPLTYHGGPIMVSSKVFTIFWIPAGYSVAAGYASKINQYFKDVAAASGQTSNVYYTEKQYYMNGPVYVSGKTSFGGSYTATNNFPANGCPIYNSGVGNVLKCLNDTQIKAQVKKVLVATGWVANSVNMFFVFTPNGVGSCFTSSGGSCAFTQYCAYHGYTGAITYANQPYTYTNSNACGVSVSPNGNFPADSTINVASHEHREAINDYHLNAWYDALGNEGSDKCAWNFGSLVSGYNQTINGHHYVLQKEWSNYSAGCVLTGN